MKRETIGSTGLKHGKKRGLDFPELQVGFPERNDVEDPNFERERVHVDLDTLDIYRTNASQFNRVLKGQETVSLR